MENIALSHWTFQYNLHGVLTLFSGFLALLLGFFVYFKGRFSNINQSFFLFTLSLSVWLICFGMMSLVTNKSLAFQLNAYGYVFGVPFIPVNTYLFSCYLTSQKIKKKLFYVGYVWAVVMAMWILSSQNSMTDVIEFSWGRYAGWNQTVEAKLNFFLLTIPFYLFSFGSFIQLYKALRKTDSYREKNQFRNCLIGLLIAYSGSADFLTAQHLNVYPFGYISLTAFSCFIAYNIVRHQVMDVRVIFKRVSLGLAIYVGLLLAVLPAAIPLLHYLLKNPDRNPIRVMVILGLLIGVVLSMGPIIYALIVKRTFWLKSHITTGLTHELKSPLGAIQGAAEILRMQINTPGTNKEKQLEYVDMVEKNAERMESFVSDLLNIAAVQEDDIRIEREPVDFLQIARNAVDHQELNARHKNLRLEFHSMPLPPIFGDKDKLSQIFSNLISNAIKYSDSGTITIELKTSGKEIICRVTDQGRGIDPKHLPLIFDRFYQATPNAKGSGIGLAIAKAWVEGHGGRIWAESRGVSKGTTILFSVPL